jgi:4-amino-4-deoxy-L-arabinose transferase-like glycosyltransferase
MLLSAIVVSSAVLSLHWVFRAPFFEEPDENAHADYAFALYTAGHPIRARDGLVATDVHPYTQYLEQVSNFRATRFNPDGRVPPGYGTAAFYRSVDAGKPRVDPHLFERPHHAVPYVAAAYSFVFYGLEAVAAGTSLALTGGSLTTAFFVMRLLCVGFMAAMLVLSFLTMRALHIDRVRALLLTAAVGWFPLFSWHAGYIQPDNLACATIALCLYLSLLISRRGLDLRLLLALGVALAMVSIAKPPQLLAVGAAAFAVVATRLPTSRTPFRSVLIWGALLVPSLALLALSHYYSATPQLRSMLAAAQSARLTDAFHQSVAAGIAASANELARASWSTYGFGATSAGFWHAFSWLDEFIEIGSFQLTFAIHMLIVTITLLIVALMLRRQLLVYRRLYSVARKRSVAGALRILGGDPVLTSYFIFAATMIAIDAFTSRAISSNRYWLVCIVPAFLCGVWYAPRSLPRARYRTLGNAVLALLVAFSLVSIPFSWRALERRYYEPVAAGHVHYESTAGIWTPADNTDVQRGQSLHFHGWAFDSTSGLPESAAYFVIDGSRRVPVTYGLFEAQFVTRMHDDGLARTGFTADIQTAGLPDGDHVAKLFVVDHAKRHTYPTTLELRFRVHSA